MDAKPPVNGERVKVWVISSDGMEDLVRIANNARVSDLSKAIAASFLQWRRPVPDGAVRTPNALGKLLDPNDILADVLVRGPNGMYQVHVDPAEQRDIGDKLLSFLRASVPFKLGYHDSGQALETKKVQ